MIAPSPDRRAETLHVFALSCAALAQPLLAVLGRNAAFFVASRASRLDIVGFVALLVILPAAGLVALEMLAGLAGARARTLVHRAVVAILLALIALGTLSHAWTGHARILVAGAILIGIAGAVLYARMAAVRTMTSLLALVVLLAPLHFLFRSEATRILFPSRATGVASRVTAATPVVVVIFDELPVASLLDRSLAIDAGRYPNFAALAATSHFFRNATSASESTTQAVPTIVTGRLPRFALLPTAADHPDSLFTWLAGSYHIEAREPVTSLCPPAVCASDDRRGTAERLRALGADAAVVLGHVLMPPTLARRFLPRIDQGWHGFAAAGDSAAAATLESRAAEDEDGSRLGVTITAHRRALYVLHFLLPHVPWRYLPSGHTYPRAQDIAGLGPDEQWGTDASAIASSYSRHLLQLGYVDRVLGQLIQRVRSAGIFDDALVVVVADHGCSFRPGDSRRRLTRSNWSDILRVPLFVKLPHQVTGSIVDRPVRMLDITSTIADVLGFKPPVRIDGRSLFDARTLPAAARTVVNGGGERIVPAADLSGLHEAVARKVAQFGDGPDLGPLFGRGRFAALVGQPVTRLAATAPPALRADLEDDEQFAAVDLSRRVVPALVRGTVSGTDLPAEEPAVAIAVNGTIRAVTPLTRAGLGGTFESLVPSTSFVDGANELSVFVVVGGSPDRPLALAARTVASSYALVRDGRGEHLEGGGTAIPVTAGAVRGTVDAALWRDMPGYLSLFGWVIDPATAKPPAVLVFADGRLVGTAAPTADRPDVAAAFRRPDLTRSGFVVRVPAAAVSGARAVRLFGIGSNSAASELDYGSDYPYRRELAYRLVLEGGHERLRSPDGALVAIGAAPITAHVESWSHNGVVHSLAVSGWAADTASARPPLVLLFADDRAIAAAKPAVPRPDVARYLRDPRLITSGFTLQARAEAIGAARRARLFAVAGSGVAKELTRAPGESLDAILERSR